MQKHENNKGVIKPSGFLPSYLKLDLNVGVAEEHPFISALDETFESWCAAAQCESLSMNRSHFRTERKKAVLDGYGLVHGVLTEKEISECYAALPNLFRNQGALTAVVILAKIYFPNQTVTVRRGRGLRRQTLKGAITFPIIAADRDDEDRTVQVSLSAGGTLQRVSEFIVNSMRFLPHGFQIVIQEPLKPPPKDLSRFNLGEKVRLTERRI